MKRILYRLYEIRVLSSKPEQASAFLETCGARPQELVFFEAGGKIETAFFTPLPATAKKVRSLYRAKRLPGMRLKIRVLNKEDWFDKWQLDYRIMPLGKKLTLVPLWQKKQFKGDRLPVYLDPQGVFGSGQHPATRMMIAFIEKAGVTDSILDLGTGTGILSVAGYRLGAKKILAVDLDAAAVRSARFNFKLNGMNEARAVKANVTRMKAGEKYGLVCANLFTGLLEKIKPFLFGSVRPGGFLALSGVHFQNYTAFKRGFHHPDFRCVKIIRSRGWSGMLFKRRLRR